MTEPIDLQKQLDDAVYMKTQLQQEHINNLNRIIIALILKYALGGPVLLTDLEIFESRDYILVGIREAEFQGVKLILNAPEPVPQIKEDQDEW